MNLSARFRFSAMMFLQYAIWGAWSVVAAAYFQQLGFSDIMTGWLFAALWLANIVAPFIGGQIADRYFPTQIFLGTVHLAGAVFLYLMAQERDFAAMMVYMALYCLLYAPTLALTNSICFHHLEDPEADFGKLRVWGTMGWIAVGWGLSGWRNSISEPVLGDLFYLAAGCSALLGIVCFFLPHTPPRKEAENPLAFLEALKLLRNRNFAIFLAIAFVVTTELQFYYIPTALFLQDIGIPSANVPALMTIGQIAEIIAMWFLLPVFIQKIGLRWTMALGVIAWPLRYVIFAIGEPLPLVVASLAFHGIGYTFFFVASQIYVNNLAGDDIRASAQSLLTLTTLGVGSYLGTMFYTFIKGLLTTDGVTDWTTLYLVPGVLTAVCAAAFLMLFKPPRQELESAG